MSIISINISPEKRATVTEGVRVVQLKGIQENAQYQLRVLLWKPGRVNIFTDNGNGKWELWQEWTNPKPRADEAQWSSGEIPLDLTEIPRKICARLTCENGEEGIDEIRIVRP